MEKLSQKNFIKPCNPDTVGTESFLKKDTISYTALNKPKGYSVERKRHLILECIKENPDKTIYFYSKKLNIAYASMHQAMKELVFCRLVAVKQGYDSNEMPCELFFIPKIKSEPSPSSEKGEATMEARECQTK